MNEATKRLNAEYREWLNVEDKKLRPLFDEMTADLNHWKNPFTCVVPVDKFADYCAAAVFYTGSELVKWPNKKRTILSAVVHTRHHSLFAFIDLLFFLSSCLSLLSTFLLGHLSSSQCFLLPPQSYNQYL